MDWSGPNVIHFCRKSQNCFGHIEGQGIKFHNCYHATSKALLAALFFCWKSWFWFLLVELKPNFSIKLTNSFDSDLSLESGWDNNHCCVTFWQNYKFSNLTIFPPKMVLGENLSFLVKFNSDSGVAVFAKIGRKSYIPWKIELKKLKKILLFNAKNCILTNFFSKKQYNFLSGFLADTILTISQKWWLSKLDSELKSESSEWVKLIEKSDLNHGRNHQLV